MRKILRLVCILMALLCLCSAAMAEEKGDEIPIRGWDKEQGYVYLTLGTFPQTKEGERLPILWRVVTVEDGRAYLLSEYVLEARRIHGDYKEFANKPTHKTKPGFDGDFAQTEMAQYLSGAFASDNFTDGERGVLTPDETYGLFFLPSADDLKNKAYGFVNNESRKAWGTDYAKENGLFVYRVARGSHSPYWAYTQSTSNAQGARCIKSQGEIGYINVITEDEGMRPACWLDLTKAAILSGEGTKDAPFTLDIMEEPVITQAVPLETPTAE